METPPANSRTVPLLPAIVGTVVVAAVLAALFYLNRPGRKVASGPATSVAKAYLPNLELEDVTMQATENFMRQQVVEVEGRIVNKGPRPLQSILVYCLFYGVDGQEIYRERVPLLLSGMASLKPRETRSFRLPFDNLPNRWNQVLPKMVIAQIDFAR